MKKLLFYLTICVSLLISCKGTKTSEQAETIDSVSPPVRTLVDYSIVYVDIDSLTENYQLAKDLMAELEEKMNRLETDLNNRQRRFQTNVNDFQNKASKGLETRAVLAQMEERLGIEQQQLMQLRERYSMEMAEEQMVMQRKVLHEIMEYLKEYNKAKGYKYILGTAFDAKILYADPSLNITAEVLEGINAKYKAEKK